MPLLLLLLPFLDLGLLIRLGFEFGALKVLGWCLLTSAIGIALIRSRSLAIVRGMQRSLQMGQSPAEPALHGMLLGVAGALLLFPGVITDILALPLLFAPIRRLLLRRTQSKAAVYASATFSAAADGRWRASNAPHPKQGDWIDAEVVPDREPTPPAKRLD